MAASYARLALLAIACALPVAGCGGSGGGAGAACAAGPSGLDAAAGHRAMARVVFVGVALAGPTSGGVLLSPARMRVVRWIKGHGPHVVTVQTGVTRRHGDTAVGEGGIRPKAGERWLIYAWSNARPYRTSDCAGSARATPTGPPH